MPGSRREQNAEWVAEVYRELLGEPGSRQSFSTYKREKLYRAFEDLPESRRNPRVRP